MGASVAYTQFAFTEMIILSKLSTKFPDTFVVIVINFPTENVHDRSENE